MEPHSIRPLLQTFISVDVYILIFCTRVISTISRPNEHFPQLKENYPLRQGNIPPLMGRSLQSIDLEIVVIRNDGVISPPCSIELLSNYFI